MTTYIEFILAPILFTYSIILSVKWKKSTKYKKLFIILSALLSFLVAYNGIKSYEKQKYIKNVEATFGEIVDGNITTIPNIRIGNTVAFTTINYSKNYNGIFLNQKTQFIKVYVKKDRLYINTVIRDYNKDVIAVISDNSWKLFDNNYEYNNDQNAIELVTKGDRNVFMHVEFKNGYVYIEGFFFTESVGAYICEGRGNENQKIIMEFIIDSYKDQNKLSFLNILRSNIIKPIFKYPREKYLGIRNTD